MKTKLLILAVALLAGCTAKQKPTSVFYTADCYNGHELVSPPFPYPPASLVLLPQFPTPPGKRVIWICHTNFN